MKHTFIAFDFDLLRYNDNKYFTLRLLLSLRACCDKNAPHCPIGMVYTLEWSRAGLNLLGFEYYYSGF